MNEDVRLSELAPESQEPAATPPVVFISYSHDSKAHKAWVAELGKRLRDNGVEVLLDQWDLEFGDDVPKFMERGVAESDRVLMLCTEAYVRKTDEGKGGVGYEAMVVTGELVQQLGTKKFIPVVRQGSGQKVLPRCVSTRLFVNLSDDADTDEEFRRLVEQIHRPAGPRKPPLGRNPFAKTNLASSTRLETDRRRRLDFESALKDAESAYDEAVQIIRAEDRVAWRRLLLAANDQCSGRLTCWRNKGDSLPSSTKESDAFLQHALVGISTYDTFIACILAAAESGTKGFKDQLGWLDSMLQPADYEQSGKVYYTRFPDTIVFVSQALFGGMLMAAGNGEDAFRLGSMGISDDHGGPAGSPLAAQTHLTGWPESLNSTCTLAREFLTRTIAGWPWIGRVFGNTFECNSGITAYYHALSLLNFVSVAKSGRLDSGDLQRAVTVPPGFCTWDRDVQQRGYRMFLNQAAVIRKVLEANTLMPERFENLWQKWMPELRKWVFGVYKGLSVRITLPRAKLPEDLKHAEFVVP